MQRIRRSQGLPNGWAILLFALALLLFVASAFAIRGIPALASNDAATLVLADFILPCGALWIAYWAIFHFSAYLRPRTLRREFGLVVLALGLLPLSWWMRVIVASLHFGI
jgi:hypothetical protein